MTERRLLMFVLEERIGSTTIVCTDCAAKMVAVLNTDDHFIFKMANHAVHQHGFRHTISKYIYATTQDQRRDSPEVKYRTGEIAEL